ncbi:hypothetical protein [Erysipelothrix aquatica]|uniref:hypothetical protein n=1 Tax=Erysipelothrix aquatica TaxID=2683714 RepID=UPI0013580B58|nr:hypothetical protein [Erysipelothrix aquatica]
MADKKKAKELMDKEQQLYFGHEQSIKFRNDEERLTFVEDPKNWKCVYSSGKFNTRVSVFTLKHIKFLRVEVLVSFKNWRTEEVAQRWQNASTRRIFEDGTQSQDTYTDNYIVNVLKEERNNL